MPLFQGDSQEIISMNIRKLISEGYSSQQAAAIALAEAEKFRKARNRRGEYLSTSMECWTP